MHMIWVQPRPEPVWMSSLVTVIFAIVVTTSVGIAFYYAKTASVVSYASLFVGGPTMCGLGVCLHRLVFRRFVGRDANMLILGRIGLPFRTTVYRSDSPAVTVEQFEGKAPEDANQTWYRVVICSRSMKLKFVFSQQSDAKAMAHAVQGVLDNWQTAEVPREISTCRDCHY